MTLDPDGVMCSGTSLLPEDQISGIFHRIGLLLDRTQKSLGSPVDSKWRNRLATLTRGRSDPKSKTSCGIVLQALTVKARKGGQIEKKWLLPGIHADTIEESNVALREVATIFVELKTQVDKRLLQACKEIKKPAAQQPATAELRKELLLLDTRLTLYLAAYPRLWREGDLDIWDWSPDSC